MRLGGWEMGPSALGPFLTLLLILTTTASGKFLEELCERSYSPNGESLTCRLRTINSEFDKTNFSAISGENVVSLNLECSDVLFYQSSLQPGFLAPGFSRLQSFSIEHCKLSRLPPSVFAGLFQLKNLTIRTHNTAWPALSLDVASGVFTQPLERIDLSANNIWTLPDRIFCPAKSLNSLNLSSNRLQDISDLGFRDEKECRLQLKVLDLSFNRLILLPPRGLSALTTARELYFQGNQISVVADRALGGLRDLRTLSLADNKIVALPESLFQESREISEIYLQNNSLSALPPKLLSKLDQLVVLDLSHNILTSNWMIRADNESVFSGLIRTVILNLGYNKLTHLSPHPFQELFSLQILNLEHNQIESIEPNTFSAMNNLHTLILSHNKLTSIDSSAFNGLWTLMILSLDHQSPGLSSLHPTAFQNTSLKDLNLNSNAFTEIPLAVQNLTLLKTIDLGENQIEQLDSPKLLGLPALYGFRMTGNKVVNLSKDALKELPSLKVLNLARNRLQLVEKGAFDSNSNLQAIRLDSNFISDISNLVSECHQLLLLNVSDNNLTWFDYALIPRQLQWLDLHKNGISELGNYFQAGDLRLQTLDASFNRITKIGPSNIPDSLEMLYINDNLISTVEPHTFYKKENLSRVDIFANQIETMDFKAIQLSPFPHEKALPEFYIGGNPITCDCTMEWLQRLNTLDHLRQRPKIMDLDSVYCKLIYNRGDKYYVPLSEADPTQFLCPYSTHCWQTCHCCEFDHCDCAMSCPDGCSCFRNSIWSTNIVDCAAREFNSVPKMIPMDSTAVYLDGNKFEILSSHQFIGRKNLHTLYLNNSNIEVIQNNSFSGLKRLEILHLENNYITELHGYEFENLEAAREIYLQFNQISIIADNTFSNLRKLEVLKIDGNRLTNFAIWTLSMNPYLVEIGLSQNPWACSCDFLASAAPWIQNNLAKLIDASGVNCRLNGKSLSLVYMNGTKCSEITALSGAVEAPTSPFFPYFPLLLLISVSCLLVGIILLICRKRSTLLLWAKCPLKHCYQSTLDDDREKLYDAYIAYSVKDESWVTQALATELQHQCDTPYRLCLHYKDFPVTAYIADTIVEAVESSRRTVIVLSKNFIQSEWCRFEFKSALHAALRGKKNRLVAITLGDLPTRELDPDLRVCLRSATVLNANDKLFWAKLRCALPNPRASYSGGRNLCSSRPGSGSSVASSVTAASSTNNYNSSLERSTLPLTLNLGNVPMNVNLNSVSGGHHTLTSAHGHGHHHPHHTLGGHHFSHHQQMGNGTLPHLHSSSNSANGQNNSHHQQNGGSVNGGVSVPLFVPPYPPPSMSMPPPPFPAPRRPPPPAPLWA